MASEHRLGGARRRAGRVLVLCWGVALLQAPVQPRTGSPNEGAAGVSVICAAERPVVHRAETVFVRVWVTNAAGEPLAGVPRFAWRAARGKISGGARAAWTLGDVALPKADGLEEPVPLTATVDVEAAGHGAGRCEVEILVVPRPRAAELPSPRQRSDRLTARILLLRGKTEVLDHGLRSYLLFSTPPRDAGERERYLRAIEAYVRVLVPLEDLLAQNRRASQLNVTMLPAVRSVDLSANLDDPSRARAVAADLLAAYDYARARVLLSDLGISALGGGPYLLSRSRPEGGPAAEAPGRSPGLLVDMTGVSPALMWDWMTWFCWLAGQERSWSEVTVKRFGLNLRNVIAVAGSMTRVVFESLGRWEYVLKPR